MHFHPTAFRKKQVFIEFIPKLFGDVSSYPEAELVGLVTYTHLSGQMMTSETIPQIYLNIDIK